MVPRATYASIVLPTTEAVGVETTSEDVNTFFCTGVPTDFIFSIINAAYLNDAGTSDSWGAHTQEG